MQQAACFFWRPLSCSRVFCSRTDEDVVHLCSASTENRGESAAIEAKAAAPRASPVESQVAHDQNQGGAASKPMAAMVVKVFLPSRRQRRRKPRTDGKSVCIIHSVALYSNAQLSRFATRNWSPFLYLIKLLPIQSLVNCFLFFHPFFRVSVAYEYECCTLPLVAFESTGCGGKILADMPANIIY